MSDRKTYAEKLKDPRWQKRRLEILERDNWTCQRCKDQTKPLAIHHLGYYRDNPWESPDVFLVTLCEDCHQDETACRKISVDWLTGAFQLTFYEEDIRLISRLIFVNGIAARTSKLKKNKIKITGPNISYDFTDNDIKHLEEVLIPRLKQLINIQPNKR